MTEMVTERYPIDAVPPVENGKPARHAPEGRVTTTEEQELALAPLVDTVAYGLARVLVVAIRELENHIAVETRKVGDNVGRRLDTLQAGFQDLSDVVSEQRKMTLQVQDKCETLLATTLSLREEDARQQADLAALRNETKELSASVSERIDGLCKELGVQQEDIAAVQSTLSGFYSRVDGLVERLDKQAAALRSMCATYTQRETELEQLVEGLARLRAYPAPSAANGL
jgi:uncharacterized protein involved in exopolysaccharide biosynthesis